MQIVQKMPKHNCYGKHDWSVIVKNHIYKKCGLTKLYKLYTTRALDFIESLVYLNAKKNKNNYAA